MPALSPRLVAESVQQMPLLAAGERVRLLAERKAIMRLLRRVPKGSCHRPAHEQALQRNTARLLAVQLVLENQPTANTGERP